MNANDRRLLIGLSRGFAPTLLLVTIGISTLRPVAMTSTFSSLPKLRTIRRNSPFGPNSALADTISTPSLTDLTLRLSRCSTKTLKEQSESSNPPLESGRRRYGSSSEQSPRWQRRLPQRHSLQSTWTISGPPSKASDTKSRGPQAGLSPSSSAGAQNGAASISKTCCSAFLWSRSSAEKCQISPDPRYPDRSSCRLTQVRRVAATTAAKNGRDSPAKEDKTGISTTILRHYTVATGLITMSIPPCKGRLKPLLDPPQRILKQK